jgi:WD40 repeat protein
MITDVTYRPDGNCLATADQNGQTAIWSLQGLFDESTMPGVESIYYDPKAQYEVRRDKSGLSVFRLSDNNQIVRFEGATNSIVFSNDGSRLAFEKSIDENKDVVNVIELSSGKVLRETAAFGNSAFALSADGSRLLFWEDGKALKELEIASGGVVKEHPDVVGSDRSRISSDGRYFATSVAVADSETEEVTSFSPIVIFDTENDQKVATIGAKGPQFSIVFSPGSDYVGATLDDTNVVIWDLKHLREHRRISAPAAISQLIFSNDSKYLAGTMGASVIVWDVMTTKPSILPHRSGTMNNVAFGKDSSWIVTTHEMELQSGAQLEVWRLPGGELTSTLQINTGISRAFFAPGDQKLALIREYLYNYDNPFSRLVFWKKDDLIQEACKRVGRNLTQEEWKQYLGTEPYHQTCENLPPGP